MEGQMKLSISIAATAIALAGAGQASAQTLGRSPLLDLGSAQAIRPEIDKRYEAALAATRAAEIARANDIRYTWASEAKVACGIAIGFLKTRTIDDDSINKCDYYAMRMTMVPPPPPPPPPSPAPPPPPAPTPPPVCAITMPIKFYFEFDADSPPADAGAIVTEVASGMAGCGWTSLSVSGHTDASGSTPYNARLSDRRAKNIAGLLVGAGVAASAITIESFGESRPAVPTPDGVREPLNRRVEITAK